MDQNSIFVSPDREISDDEFAKMTSDLEEKNPNKKNDHIPLVKIALSFSEDGKWFIIKKTETTIYPTNYLRAIVANKFPNNSFKA